MFIPSINIGLDKSRTKIQLGADTNTTAEIGYFQPTFCREIVPDSHLTISSRNAIRLSPLAVPTFGRLSLRNYYYFVDYTTLWTPFDAFRNGTNYTYGDGSVHIPNYVPTFTFIDLMKYINRKSNTSEPVSPFAYDICCSIYKNDTAANSASEFITDVDLNQLPFTPFLIRVNSTNGLFRKSANTPTYSSWTGTDDVNNTTRPYITNQTADFAIKIQGTNAEWTLLGKFYGSMQRLRKHFIGAGYAFNIYDDQRCNILKLLAIYKAWYDTFGVNRTTNFNNTKCYSLIKKLSETWLTDTDILSTAGGSMNDPLLFADFLWDLQGISYVLPADYFSASDETMSRGYNGQIQSPTIISAGQEAHYDIVSKNTYNSITGNTPSTAYGLAGAIAMQMAQKMLKYVNKRSVIGKKIQDLLKLNNEVDLHNNEHETVHHLGSDKTNIEISDVTSLADTSTASLGDYAGKGVGFGATDHFSYDSKAYGVVLCLSAIVPVASYFQGISRENTNREKYDFFTNDFDAIGYQSIRMNELVADRCFQSSSAGTATIGTNLGMWGLTPRYTHLKVAKPIVNGQMSLPSTMDSLLCYNLDRHFISRKPIGNTSKFEDPALPVNVPEVFRAIKSDTGYGDYNRIFQYVGDDYDHFIIQMVFDCDVVSPMKSIASSYDTFDQGDDISIEVNKQ